jgi:hypothetical protein
VAVFTTERTARKPRKCSRCGGTIRPGERYTSIVITPGGEFGYEGWSRLAEHLSFMACDYELAAPKATGEKEQLMDQFKTGDIIEHRLMPGYPMKVEDTCECEIDGNRPELHLAYKVTDPDGNTDWLCAHDVQKPGQNLAWS